MDGNRKPANRETGTALAITGLLCSVLVLTAVCGSLWMLRLLVTGSGLLGSTLLSEVSRY